MSIEDIDREHVIEVQDVMARLRQPVCRAARRTDSSSSFDSRIRLLVLKYGDGESAFFVSLNVRSFDRWSVTTRSRRRVPCRYLSSMRLATECAAARQSAARPHEKASFVFDSRVLRVVGVASPPTIAAGTAELHRELSREPRCASLLRCGLILPITGSWPRSRSPCGAFANRDRSGSPRCSRSSSRW